MLYCLKCGKWAYRKNHPCSINSLVPLKKECRGIADKLYSLGIEILSAAWFVYSVQDSTYEQTILISIELKRNYPTSILGDLCTGWKFYTETITQDPIPLLILGYSENFTCTGVLTIEDRVKEIIKEFGNHLDTAYDPQAIKAVLKLAGYDIVQ